MIAGLPYDAELEYLETTGTQYVDKIYEFPGTENSIRYEFGAILTQQTSTNQSFFFIPPSGNGARAMFYQSTNIFGSCDLGGGYSVSGVSIGTYFDAKVGFASDDSIIITVGSSTKHFSRTFYRCNHVLLFANNPRYSASAKLYYARVIVDSVLVRDLIPVRFTNELGQAEGAVYDRVSRKLFRNQGTGDPFVLGPDKAATSVPVMGLHFMRRPRYTAKDYVQDGLVAMWDGIENAGWGVHDQNATMWRELISGTDCAYSDANGTPNWVSNGWESVVTDGKYFDAFYPDGLAEHHTLQFVVTKSTAYYAARGIICGAYSLSGGNGCNFEYRTSNATNGILRAYYSGNPDFSTSAVWELGLPSAFSMIHDNSTYSILQGVDALATVTNSYNLLTQSIMRIGADSRASSFTFGGVIHSIRFYNRALTAAEIAHNYAVDKERFNLP